MNLTVARPPTKPQKRRSLATLSLALAAALSLTITTPATAAPEDALNVRFGGSLVGNAAYTTTEGEQMAGVLHRAEGSEEQLAGGGVSLTAANHGIIFEPSSLSLGEANATTPFIAEMEFTPTSLGSSMSTLLSAGGNMFVRVKDGALEYGFSSKTGSGWGNAVAAAPLPALDRLHQLSVHYSPGEPATLNVSLDGEALPAATGQPSFALAGDGFSHFGFGTDVHPGATDRGFPMNLARVRVAQAAADYNPAAFEFQPQALTTDLLDVEYEGSFSGSSYTAAPQELAAADSLTRRTGTERVTDGSLTLEGDKQAAQWTSEESLGSGALTQSFVAEAAFTAAPNQTSLGTILAVGGNLFVRYAGDKLQYGYSANVGGTWKNFFGTTPAPSANERHVFSFAYDVHEDNMVTFVAALDGQVLPFIEGTDPSTPSGTPLGTLAIGNDANPGAANRGFVGTIDRTRFALLNRAFDVSAFKLQDAQLPEPVECTPLEELSPANYITVSTGDCADNILAKAAAVRPTAQQQDWQEVGLTAFLHFGINTFYNQEWGHGTEDPGRFNPTDEVDADAWVRQLRDAGFRYAILTVKHHDGFLSYPSRYTDYDVASTPWLDGEGNVLREFTDAAHRYGMKVGVYMSPADSNQEVDGVYGNGSEKSPRTIPTLVENDDRAGQDLPTFTYEASDYGEYFLNTLYEVLTEYGQIDEVWFDGAEGNTTKHETYDYPAFYDMISQLQPNAVVAVGGRDVRWVGNEQGIARHNEWGPVAINDSGDGGKIDGASSSSFEDVGSNADLVNAVQQGGANALHWWPTEADMKLTQGWFAHPNDAPKSGPKLLQHYEQTVGRNSVMLLNVPPTTTGKFAQSSIDAINSFAAERRKAFTRDHALGLQVNAGGEESLALTDGNARTSWLHEGAEAAAVEIDLGDARTIDRIMVGEDTLAHGQTVTQFHIEALIDGSWKNIAEAGTIGVKRLVTLGEAVTAQQFRVVIDEARGSYSLAHLAMYETLASDPGGPTDVYVDCAALQAGDGSKDRPFSSLEQFRDSELSPGANILFKSGVDCPATQTPFWGYGTDDAPITVTTYDGDVAPLIGDVSASEFFAAFADRGWVTDLAEAPEPGADAGTDANTGTDGATGAAADGNAGTEGAAGTGANGAVGAAADGANGTTGTAAGSGGGSGSETLAQTGAPASSLMWAGALLLLGAAALGLKRLRQREG